jgi:ribose transport system ATP-binding protein
LAQAGALQFENVAKAFGGTQALKGVSFAVNRGEVVALLGENGAGKSTLIKVLGGIVAADSGTVRVDGEPYRHRADIRQRVAFVHQDLGLIEWMTVAENMALAQAFRAAASSGVLAPSIGREPRRAPRRRWRWLAAASTRAAGCEASAAPRNPWSRSPAP